MSIYDPGILTPTFGAFSVDSDELTDYTKDVLLATLSTDAEFSFKCEIDAEVLGKICGIDYANGPDITASSFVFTQPIQVQVRRHKKRRINKKWAKRYGYKTIYKSYILKDVQFIQDRDELRIIGNDIAIN